MLLKRPIGKELAEIVIELGLRWETLEDCMCIHTHIFLNPGRLPFQLVEQMSKYVNTIYTLLLGWKFLALY